MPVNATALGATPSPPEFHQADRSRKPDSRYRRVLELVEHQPRPLRCKVWDDQFVSNMRTFMIRRRAGNDRQRKQLATQFPAQASALEIFERADQEPRLNLECRLLAGQSDEVIADRLGLKAETVAVYAALLFDVRDRLQFKQWIESAVLDSSGRQGMPEFERWMKVLAFAAGPVGVDSLLDNDPARREQIRNVAALAETFNKAFASEYSTTQKAELARFIQSEHQAEKAAVAMRNAFVAAANQTYVTIESAY